MKRVLDVRREVPVHWVGDGFPVRSLFTYNERPSEHDPFLLLDYAAPYEFKPADHLRGVGAHPHRGFETVTLVYQGELEHRDSSGSSGSIGPGDVQWMTAGSGIVHEEFHSRRFTAEGGTFEIAQLWVNLPAADKTAPPGYQEVRSAQIPVAPLPEESGSVRVIAGSFQGTAGPARTFTPIDLWELELTGGRSVSIELPEGRTTLLLVRRGRLTLQDAAPVGPGELARLSRDGTTLRLESSEETSAVLLSGEPIGEPVVGRGPFVMNSQEEIVQAIVDFQEGRMGRLD